MEITVIGLGYVGIATSIGFAELGHTVFGIDIDQEKVESYKKGKMPFYEEFIQEKLVKHLNTNFFPFNSLKDGFFKSNLFFICVDTPSGPSGKIDLTYINNVASQISDLLKKTEDYKTFVIKSTVIPGTTHGFGKRIERYSGKELYKDFSVAIFPEFLREGTAYKDFMEPDRIVLGVKTSKDRELLTNLFSSLKCPKRIVDTETAEFSKYTSNSFLSMKISFANELANLIDQFNLSSSNNHVNIEEVIEIVGLDHRINPSYLRPGVGYGGSCFPKDVKAFVNFANKYSSLRLLEEADNVNSKQPFIIIQHLIDIAGDLNDKPIAILGLSYKPNTDDIRRAPSKLLIQELLDQGAVVNAWDPLACEKMSKRYPTVNYYSKIETAINESSYAIIVTEWEELKQYFQNNTPEIPVIDGRGIFPNAKRSIGRSLKIN